MEKGVGHDYSVGRETEGGACPLNRGGQKEREKRNVQSKNPLRYDLVGGKMLAMGFLNCFLIPLGPISIYEYGLKY
jgi:hypothetical protein